MATTIKRTQTKRLPGRGWITYALLDDPATFFGATVFAAVTDKYPEWNFLEDIERYGHRPPMAVARATFPEVFSQPLEAQMMAA